MLKFLQNTETTFLGKLKNIATAYLINVIWVVLVVVFYKWLFETNFEGFNQFFNPYKRAGLIDFISAVVLAPLIEEILCRKFPLDLVKGRNDLLIPTMLFTSVVFGLMHQGVWSVPIQGVGGFILACVYIKNGYSYASSVALHFLWNLSLTLGVLNL